MSKAMGYIVAMGLALAALICFPLAGYLIGSNIESWNIAGLEQSPGISPAEARAMTYNWSSLLGWIGFWIGFVIFLITTVSAAWWAISGKTRV